MAPYFCYCVSKPKQPVSAYASDTAPSSSLRPCLCKHKLNVLLKVKILGSQENKYSIRTREDSSIPYRNGKAVSLNRAMKFYMPVWNGSHGPRCLNTQPLAGMLFQ